MISKKIDIFVNICKLYNMRKRESKKNQLLRVHSMELYREIKEDDLIKSNQLSGIK